MRKKEKWTNKGNDKQANADSVKSNPIFIQTFKIIGLKVPEKTLTQICICFTFEWQMKKGKMDK